MRDTVAMHIRVYLPAGAMFLLLCACAPLGATGGRSTNGRDAGAAIAPFHARLDSVSRSFLGCPYKGGPLGEGDSLLGDPAPRMRTDSFDCVTYIETAEAFARSVGTDSVLPWMDRIRYDGGRVSWEHRSHFTEADWLPAGSLAGRVRLDASESDSVDARTLAREAFYGKRGFRRPDTTVHLPLITRAKAMKLFAQPSRQTRIRGIGLVGTRPGLGILHTGFLVERPGEPALMRHASQAGTVREEPLEGYLRSKPRFIGIVLWEYLP